MNLKQAQINVIEMLIKNEETISQLYRAYAQRFPEYKAFWSNLATEEITHAAWIRQLHKKIDEGSLYFDESRFNTVAIQTFLNYLNREIAKVNEKELQVINALSVSLYIEEALIERKFFEIFETDSVELKNMLRDLYSATEEHVKRVRDVWSEHRRQPG